MCAIEMTGEQLYSWMSTVADMLCVSDGKAAFKEGTSIYGVDTFYGLDYIFDLSKPEGERVVKAESTARTSEVWTASGLHSTHTA